MPKNVIDISVNEREFNEVLRSFSRMSDSIDSKFLKSSQRRALKPMVEDMKRNSHSLSLVPMIGVTTSKKRAGELGAKVGVVKAGNKAEFPTLTAQALAAVIEYGTAERYRTLKSLGFISGRVSTGSMPAAPFLRPAWDKNVVIMMSKVEKSIYAKVKRSA